MVHRTCLKFSFYFIQDANCG
uniref:Uncharacterized protein n=1 Tax=Arundo donax TaxID=35708 RepID=A0A0A9AWG9_ARUDO